MDKKKLLKVLPQEDLQGFQDFIEAQPKETNFLPKTQTPKKESSFEHFEFLTTDAQRLLKIKNLLGSKLPFFKKFNQAQTLIRQQQAEITFIKNNLFMISDNKDSLYRKSLSDVFDNYFEPPKESN